jgi:hypothetical protein
MTATKAMKAGNNKTVRADGTTHASVESAQLATGDADESVVEPWPAGLGKSAVGEGTTVTLSRCPSRDNILMLTRYAQFLRQWRPRSSSVSRSSRE